VSPLTVGQKSLYPRLFNFAEYPAVAEMALSFGGFLRQDVPESLFFVFDLSAAGKGIPFGGGFSGFHFRHKP
jgi:hypothetical protein